MRKLLIILVACAALLSACGEGDPEIVGIRASIDPAVGDGRFLFGVNEIDGGRRGGPDEAVSVVASPLDHPDVVVEAEAEFVWVVPNAFGLYKVDIPWEEPGTWEIDFSISTGEVTQPFLVLVAAEMATAAIGEEAPLVASATLSDTSIDDITTDYPVYEPFYELSLDEALENGKKTVAIFATPAYCTSAACGPMMQIAKAVAPEYPDVNWVHVEVYQGFNEDGFAPDVAHLAPAVSAFELPSEPWIFIMDEDGVIEARVEGVLADGELESLLDA